MRRQGLTLLEVLVAVGLFSLLMTFASQLMGSGIRHSLREMLRTERQYQLQTLVAFLRGDLVESDLPGIWMNDQAVAVVPVQTLSSQGKGIWAQHINLYVWKDSVLSRYTATQGLGAFQLGTTASPVWNEAAVTSLLGTLPRSAHRWPGLREWSLRAELSKNSMPAYSLHAVFQDPEVPGQRREAPTELNVVIP